MDKDRDIKIDKTKKNQNDSLSMQTDTLRTHVLMQTILQSTCTITHCPLLKLTSLFRPSEKFGTHSIILGIVLFFSASLNSWQMICVVLIMLESLICLSSDNTIFSHLGAGARFPDFYCVFYVTKLCVSTKAMFQ